MSEQKTYTISPKSHIEPPEEWADVFRVFKGILILPESHPMEGYFLATDEAREKVEVYLNDWYHIKEL